MSRVLVAQSHANVKVAGSYSGLLIGAVGKTHLDIEDLAIMRAMPEMTVLAPADNAELVAMMEGRTRTTARCICGLSATLSRMCCLPTTPSPQVRW